MTSTAMVRALFGFNQAMNQRLWTIIMEHLTDQQFVQEDGYSHGSIRNQLLHMANAQRYWLRGMLRTPGSAELDAEDYPIREAARLICLQVDQQTLDSVRGLSEADLERIPDVWSLPVWVGLLQVAYHSTDHRSQILRTLHDLGAPTFDQNFAVYLENATPISVQELIGQISQKRAEWDDLLRQTPVEQMNQRLPDGWTVRDLIAILTWSDRRVTEMIGNRVVTDISFRGLAEAEQDSILKASRALPPEALLDQHQAAYHAMLDAIWALSDDDLNSDQIEGLPPDERFWKAIAPATWWRYPGFSERLRPF